MKKPVKAALLSSLIFPGAGHVFLRRYISSFVLATFGGAAFYILISHAISTAQILAGRILNGEINPSITNIRTLIAEHQTADEAQLVSIATSLFIVVWIIAIVDSYRVGVAESKGR